MPDFERHLPVRFRVAVCQGIIMSLMTLYPEKTLLPSME